MATAALTPKHDLSHILSKEVRDYGYLFPKRYRLPPVKRGTFDVLDAKERLDRSIVRVMLDLTYIGWTCSVLLNIWLLPFQMVIIRKLFTKPFPMLVASRGGSKSFILAVYCLLRALLDPGVKIVIVGAGLRQARLVFQYIEAIWDNAPILRSIVGGGKKAGPRQNVDMCYFKIGLSMIQAVPLGDGTRIRGLRANVVIADEFASIPEEIFDVVVRGFGATSKDPVGEAKKAAFEKRLKEAGVPQDIQDRLLSDGEIGNQIIYSGTAYYAFNHFAKRWKMWKDIILSRGDPERVADIFGGAFNVPKKFDWRDYVVIRIPYNHLQEGLLDQRQLANAKAALPKNIFLMEYGACFVADSDGYFSRSLIESCTCGVTRTVPTLDGDVTFTPLMHRIEGHSYVIGIDPAAQRDNLAVVVMEVFQNHARVAYCWTCNRREFLRRKKLGLVKEEDYYAYCASRIRDIVRAFGPQRIEMDSYGGGLALAELLRNKKLLDPAQGDFPIYEVPDPVNPKAIDLESDGPHILHLLTQNNEWNYQSNMFLHKSLEMRRLLFPAFDTVKMQASLAAEKAAGTMLDTYEDAVNEIEELKNELCTIQLEQTTTGKERFGTPSTVVHSLSDGHKRTERLKKDRYSALLFAHRYFHDNEVKVDVPINYEDVAGNIRKVNVDPNEGMYRGPGLAAFSNADWGKDVSVGAVKGGKPL